MEITGSQEKVIQERGQFRISPSHQHGIQYYSLQCHHCNFTTPSGAEMKDMLDFMKLHTQQAHPALLVTGRETRPTTKVDNMPRLVMNEEMSEHDWRFFGSEWEDYKRATGVTGQNVLDVLWSCMADDLRRMASGW